MTFLHLISYIGLILVFICITLSLASGLYYLAEVVEEHSQITKKVIQKSIWAICIIHILLFLVDSFPVVQISFSIICHLVYSLNLKTFPMVNLTSPAFILSAVLVVVDHLVWFNYFSSLRSSPSYGYEHYSKPSYPFAEIATFFGICVWLIPFSLFVSLSANDFTLPSYDHGSVSSASTSVNGVDQPKRSAGMLKTVMNSFLKLSESVTEVIYRKDPKSFYSEIPSQRKKL